MLNDPNIMLNSLNDYNIMLNDYNIVYENSLNDYRHGTKPLANEISLSFSYRMVPYQH